MSRFDNSPKQDTSTEVEIAQEQEPEIGLGGLIDVDSAREELLAQMPQGAVTDEQVDSAKDILDQVTDIPFVKDTLNEAVGRQGPFGIVSGSEAVDIVGKEAIEQGADAINSGDPEAVVETGKDLVDTVTDKVDPTNVGDAAEQVVPGAGDAVEAGTQAAQDLYNELFK